MRILSVGTRFFPHLHAGDKNFWLYLFRELSARGDSVHVISIDLHAIPPATIAPNFTLETFQATPIYLRSVIHRDRYNTESQDIPAVTNYASRTLTWLPLLTRIAQLVESWSPDVIHFMDNLGPTSLAFARRLTRPSFVSAITYDPRNRLYDPLLWASLHSFDGVAVTSDAFRNRLAHIGVRPERIRTVRWGVDPRIMAPAPDRAAAKKSIGLDPAAPVVLWSGYVQQTTQTDLYTAYYTVVDARKTIPNLVGEFCLKPQHYRPSYRAMEGPGIRVHGDGEWFARSREAADVFLGPVCRRNSILAPPLTWVECLMKGIPVITTPCRGADEVLGQDQGGIVVPPEQLSKGLVNLIQDRDRLAALQRTAVQWGRRNYSLEGSIDGYRNLWGRRT